MNTLTQYDPTEDLDSDEVMSVFIDAAYIEHAITVAALKEIGT